MATQLPASTDKPAAILIHMVWSALGDIFCVAKNLSRRRRKTFGKDDRSDGSGSSMSGLGAISGGRVITDRVSDVTGASTNISNRLGAFQLVRDCLGAAAN